MTGRSCAVFRRNTATAREIERILELPNDRWLDVQVAFGTDEFATAKVTLWLSAEQLQRLAYAAAYRFKADDAGAGQTVSGTEFLLPEFEAES